MRYDRRYQAEYNGPLTASVRKRLNTAKNKLNLTLAKVGQKMEFSGPFMSQLLRDDDPARIRTKHIERVIAALEKLEAEAGLTGNAPAGEDKKTNSSGLTLEEIVHAAHKLGFEISLKPLGR